MRRQSIGNAGEEEVTRQLEVRGWTVTSANAIRANYPNVDLFAEKSGRRIAIQVKSSAKDRGYITGGSVSKRTVDGAAIFNRVANGDGCHFVIFIAASETAPRFFVMPVAAAESVFRRNVESYFKTPKLNGDPKKPVGQCDIFVGRGEFPHARIVPDQRAEVLPYEGRWDLIETGSAF